MPRSLLTFGKQELYNHPRISISITTVTDWKIQPITHTGVGIQSYPRNNPTSRETPPFIFPLSQFNPISSDLNPTVSCSPIQHSRAGTGPQSSGAALAPQPSLLKASLGLQRNHSTHLQLPTPQTEPSQSIFYLILFFFRFVLVPFFNLDFLSASVPAQHCR